MTSSNEVYQYARGSAICMLLVLVVCSSQPVMVHAVSLPHLQEGLTLKYEQRYAWTHPNWGGREFGLSRDVTIKVVDVDDENDKIRIRYESSAIVTFPPGTKSSKIVGVNLDGSKPVFNSGGETAKRSWSVRSFIILSGRAVVGIEEDRVDFLWLRAEGDFGTWTDGQPWTSCYDWKWTDFPPGYPAWFFLYPGVSPGDSVWSYWKGLKNGSPGIEDSYFSISGTATYSSPLGDRETLVAESKEVTSQEAGAWHFERRTLWDRETGILLYHESSGTNPRGEGEERTRDQVRLVDIYPLPIAVKTTPATEKKAVSLPYLQEGLTLKYQHRYAWTGPHFGNGEFASSSESTLRVLHVDQANDRITIYHEDSYAETFPPGTRSSRYVAFNFDGSKPVFKIGGNAEERVWSLKRTVVLSGRTVASIEGERVDFIWFRADGRFGDWAYCYDYRLSIFQIGYPNELFLYPGTSPGDNIPVANVEAKEYGSAPRIGESSLSITGTATYSSPVGDREVLVAESKTTSGEWRGEQRYIWDRETGILLFREIHSETDLGQGEEKFSSEYRLVEANPWPTLEKKRTTSTAEAEVTGRTSNIASFVWSSELVYLAVAAVVVVAAALAFALRSTRLQSKRAQAPPVQATHKRSVAGPKLGTRKRPAFDRMKAWLNQPIRTRRTTASPVGKRKISWREWLNEPIGGKKMHESTTPTRPEGKTEMRTRPTSRMVVSAPQAKTGLSATAVHTKFCRFCGAKIRRDSKFCEECGAKLT